MSFASAQNLLIFGMWFSFNWRNMFLNYLHCNIKGELFNGLIVCYNMICLFIWYITLDSLLFLSSFELCTLADTVCAIYI